MPNVEAIEVPERRGVLPLVVVLLLIVGFALHAIAASRGKSSTFDEPVHALSSALIVRHGDFRVNPEHPSLWKYVAGLGSIGLDVPLDLNTPAAREPLSITESQWNWTIDTLYGADRRSDLGERLVARERIAMSLFTLLTAAAVARWAWRAGGPTSALIATALLSFDPNFLAHGALVTNDVAATCCFVWASYFTWCLGIRFAWTAGVGLVLTCAAGAGVKFTCLVIGPIAFATLLCRALLVTPGPSDSSGCGASRVGRVGRVGTVMAIGVATLVTSWALLWPAYQFRAAPVPDGSRFDAGYAHRLLAYNTIAAEARSQRVHLSDAQIKERVPAFCAGAMTRVVEWLGEHRRVPQAWSYGLTYADARRISRPSFLLGEQSDVGSAWFFPIAMLAKTPVATLAILAFAGVYVVALVARRRMSAIDAWVALGLLGPATLYLALAMSSHLNIGLRHVLPVYPPLFVGAGVLLAPLVRQSALARRSVVVALLALCAETTLAFPNYINFFNAPAKRLSAGGLSLLSDSNLDWGQDLPAVADFYRTWRAANPGRPFYLCYFGSADPHAFGIDYVNALGGYPFDRIAPVESFDSHGGLLAISATYLQGTYGGRWRTLMSELRATEPYAVLNGTIYIYALPADGRR